jgi:hypothetical protein
MIPPWLRVEKNIFAYCTADVMTNDGRLVKCNTSYQDADRCPRAEKHVDDAASTAGE